MKEVRIINRTANTIAVSFLYDQTIIDTLKQIPTHRWDPDRKEWLFEKNLYIREAIYRAFRDYHIIDIDSLSEIKELEQLQNELQSRKYSRKTVKSYMYYNKELVSFCSKPVNEIEYQDIVRFLAFLAEKRNYNESSVNLAISALKFFFVAILGKKFLMEKKRPKKDKRLPAVLSKEQVKRILEVSVNLKHKAILALVYSGGLRVSEITKLKYKDIERDRGMVYIQRAKGRKDRYTVLSKKAHHILEEYVRVYHPGKWLFPGQNPENHISIRTVEKIFKTACMRAGIPESVAIHSLRHSFATHLLESGTDIRYIQTLLGHASVKTTSIYTHVAKHDFLRIESPLDTIDNPPI